MDSRRTFLWVVFSMSLLFLWDRVQIHNGHQSMFFSGPQAQKASAAGSSSDVPVATAASTSTTSTASAAVPTAAGEAPAAVHQIVKAGNDVIAVEFDTLGAEVKRVELLKHRATEDNTQNMVLLDSSPNHVYLAQSGLIGNGAALPTHRTPFAANVSKAADGSSMVSFTAEAGGVKLVKTYTLKPGSYEIGVRHEVFNTGTEPVAPQLYLQLVRDGSKPAGGSRFYSTFNGTAVYSDTSKFQKVSFEDIEKGKGPDKHVPAAADGWVAVIQHYFVSAWVPQNGQRDIYTDAVESSVYGIPAFRVGIKQSLGTIAPGASVKNEANLFAGPQDEHLLESVAPGLELVRDYGWTKIIAAPVFWLLNKLHSLIGNWGWSIIALTVLIKAVFFPLSAASYRSMAKMKAVGPRMKAIQEKYKDDRMKMNQAVMELYKTEKINPLGGCLPIVIQIPVFMSLYSVLLASVEMRGAPWLGWISDLAVSDPYYILPVLMMISMFIQFKLNPAPPDPTQAKMMMIMPVVFGVTFFFFPAGLVLYWVVNNTLSIAQQWQITRMLGTGKTDKAPKPAAT